jgi:hypothetical protein
VVPWELFGSWVGEVVGAPVITPSVPLANDRMRLACKSSENTRTINS